MNPDDKNRKQLQDILNGKDVMAEQSKARRVRIIAARKASETRIRKAKSQIFEANETQIHTDCIEWFKAQYRKLYDAGKLVHHANERKCTYRQGKILKDMGVVKGVSDLELYVARKGYHGLLIEMKRPHTYQTPEQKKWQQSVEEEGYRYEVCRSLEEFMSIVNGYLI